MNEYKIFEGKPYAELMKDLKDEGYRPMDMRNLVEKRLEALASGDEEERDKFVNQSLDSSTGIVTYKRETEDGIRDEIKIIPRCEFLENIDINQELYNGRLKLTEEQYNQLEGKVFNRKDLILNEFLTEEEAKEHSIWKELLGGTLKDYVNTVFDFEKKHGRNTAMGVWVHKGEDVPMLRSCYVDRFINDYYGRSLYGFNILDYGTRLVGVKDAKGVAENSEKSENFKGVLSKYGIDSAEELRKALDMYKHAKSVLEQ